ncbi:MAG TPA: hypothetical protein DCQ93_04665 [Bacteroidetes bacterium]|nr:hypothetical protein [Bacteroidota bacterium]
MKKIFTTLVFGFISLLALAQNPAPCSDLFFSEYIKGTSNNKALEIYNPTSGAIDLTNYKIMISFNGGSSFQSFYLSGSLASNGVYVACHSSADSAILAVANLTNAGISFNGNDAIALIDTATNDTIDRIGVLGVDPGLNGWTVGSGSTLNHTLVRMASVNNGQYDWAAGANEWDVYAVNDFSHLGSHTMNPCSVSTNPDVHLISVTQSVGEPFGPVTIQIGISNPNNNPTTVQLSTADITATSGVDYQLTPNPVTVTFPANSSATQSVNITITDDAAVEGDETFFVNLSNATNSAAISVAQETVTILDDDQANPIQIRFLVSADTVEENISQYFAQLDLFAGAGTPNATSIDVSAITGLGTATGGGVDYTFSDTTLTWPSGDQTAKFAVYDINDDILDEPLEFFALILSNPTNGALLGVIDTCRIYINDNDPNSVKNIFSNGNVKLIPNPANDKLLIWMNEKFDSYSVMDVTGKIVLEGKIENEKTQTLNISNLAKGIYMLRLNNDDSYTNMKFIKQ